MSELLEWLKADHCTCIDDYKKRDLTDPNCWYCTYGDYLTDAAKLIESQRAFLRQAAEAMEMLEKQLITNENFGYKTCEVCGAYSRGNPNHLENCSLKAHAAVRQAIEKKIGEQ